ncbi:PAS domain-containing protein [Paraburkholderia madseniana]|uniref:histidine kinase n=1 Tax=Paraburkholderia madseniana TaxID=2599607 RepID=A0A6N6WAQ6_9BURK|nr:histidine kinase [Paraburkholderia madseniana]KAE8756620.1 PAS domain-containing protein [Paraburkholderia madseniana]NPT68822.1 PAS domain-containing protein [Paraburkholderia madseniana]
MDANEPTGLQMKLADLIEAMRKLCIAARTHKPATANVTDARGAALAILTSDGTFLSANRTAAALLGYSNADLVGKQLADMAPNSFWAPLASELSVSAHREFHSFPAVLSGRTGHPIQLMLHQQSVPTGETGRSALLTLFEEPLISGPELANATRLPDASARDHLTYLTMGQQKERQRLAAELHDGLGQALTLVKLMAEDALIRIRRGQVDDAAQLLDATVLRIRETIGDVRQICGELRPLMLDQLGLPGALGSLCRRIEHGAENVSVVFNCDVGDEDVPEHLKADIFRLAQEALNNTVKHAAATEVTLGFRRIAGGLLMTILDNGIGYENRPLSTEDACTTGLGLIGMQHRVESHGGKFSIQSFGTSGTLVSAAWTA